MDEITIRKLINKTNDNNKVNKSMVGEYDLLSHSVITKYLYNNSNSYHNNNKLFYELYKRVLGDVKYGNNYLKEDNNYVCGYKYPRYSNSLDVYQARTITNHNNKLKSRNNNIIFLLDSDRERLLNVLNQYQRIKFSIIKLKNIYKYKHRYAVFDYNYDIEMNEICRLPKRNVVSILENNTIYTFSLIDIIKIISVSINNVENFIHRPYKPRNPFTNTPFSYSNMINIYFSLLNSGIKYSTQIDDYYSMNFNLMKYKSKYYFFMLENYIDKDFLNNDDKIIYDEIYDMYDTARNHLEITTLKIKKYSEVNKHYIRYVKRELQQTLIYYIMTTIIDTKKSHDFYLKKFIKEFKHINMKNSVISNFEEFENNRVNLENKSLFSDIHKNVNVKLFSDIHKNSND